MGTNYYAIPKATEKRKKLISEMLRINDFDSVRELLPTKVHIGKSSGGWRFVFNHNDWKYFKQNRTELESFLKICTIKNEYGDIITYEKFWEMVEAKECLASDYVGKEEHFGLIFSNCTDFC